MTILLWRNDVKNYSTYAGKFDSKKRGKTPNYKKWLLKFENEGQFFAEIRRGLRFVMKKPV